VGVGRGHLSPVFLRKCEMKEKLYHIAQTAQIGKSFEIIEIVEERSDKFVVYIESLEGITIKDCEILSKHILTNLPKEINIELTVSSAGIDRPLRAPIQFKKNIGKNVEIKTNDGKRYVGLLTEYSDEYLAIVEKKTNKEMRFDKLNIYQVKVKIF